MKKICTLLFALLLIFNFSCTKKKIGFFNNSSNGYVTIKKDASIQKLEEPVSVTASLEKSEAVIIKNSEMVKAPAIQREIEVKESKAESRAENKVNVTKEERKELKKEIKRLAKQESANRSGLGTLILVVLALILPPLAVLLIDGLAAPFWLSVLLTILFWIPGVIYALYRVFRRE